MKKIDENTKVTLTLGQLKKLVKESPENEETGGRKTYIVDVHCDIARCYNVEASSEEEAEEIVWKRFENGEIDVMEDDFEPTDDIEVKTAGYKDDSGDSIYYS